MAFIVRVETEDGSYAHVDKHFKTYKGAERELNKILDGEQTSLDDSPIINGWVDEEDD